MILTNKQEEGLKEALIRHNNREKFITISGYAGTGKSTLVRFIIEALDVEESKVAYATYTGKAAEVLRKKGNKNAMTLHKLLYDSIPRQGGGFIRIPKKSLGGITIVVVDEVSMVPKTMIEMLLAHKIFVIFLGDPFQLSMIDKNQSHSILEKPHVFLDQIMRQAEESEIIRLTKKIREGESIDFCNGNEVMIIPRKELVTGHLLWADNIITATNATRYGINKQMRELLGYTGDLQAGEKIIIKRNYWDDCNEDGDALVNGTIGIVNNVFESFIQIPGYIKNDRHRIPTLMAEFTPDGSKTFGTIAFDIDFMKNETPCVDWRVAYQIGRLKNKIGDILPKQATYGYALTCHASQGSEWDKALVIEESFPFDKKEHARWLYTAATRAAIKLVLVR